jgi:hypothetical protein
MESIHDRPSIFKSNIVFDGYVAPWTNRSVRSALNVVMPSGRVLQT